MNVTHALAIALFEWRRQQAISSCGNTYMEDYILGDPT